MQASMKAEQLLHRLGAAADASGAMGLEFGRLAKFEEAEVAVRVRWKLTTHCHCCERSSLSRAAGGGRVPNTGCMELICLCSLSLQGRYADESAAQRTVAADARAIGAAAVRACRLGRAAAEQLAVRLQPLHNHLAMAPSVSRAISDRADALLTWQTLASEISTKKARLAQVQAEPAKARGAHSVFLRICTLNRQHLHSQKCRIVCSVFVCEGGIERLSQVPLTLLSYRRRADSREGRRPNPPPSPRSPSRSRPPKPPARSPAGCGRTQSSSLTTHIFASNHRPPRCRVRTHASSARRIHHSSAPRANVYFVSFLKLL